MHSYHSVIGHVMCNNVSYTEGFKITLYKAFWLWISALKDKQELCNHAITTLQLIHADW